MSDSDPRPGRLGAFLAFGAYHSLSGYMEVVELYKIYERGEERLFASPEFIGRLLGYISSSIASMFIGGMILGATLCPSCSPELGYLGVLFMIMCCIPQFMEGRGGSMPTWTSKAFIWLACLCLE